MLNIQYSLYIIIFIFSIYTVSVFFSRNFEIHKYISLSVLKKWWEIQIFDHQRPWSPKSAQ